MRSHTWARLFLCTDGAEPRSSDADFADRALLLPSFKEELDKMENEAAEKRRLEREQAKSEL